MIAQPHMPDQVVKVKEIEGLQAVALEEIAGITNGGNLK